jgi:hypothetical protein
MKIASKRLEGTEPAPEVSTGNQPPATPPQPRVPHTPPYAPSEVSTRQVENKGIYPREAKSYVESLGFAVDLTFQAVLDKRAKGEKVVTPREADIAYRGTLDLNSETLLATLLHFGGFLVEGTPGEEGNTFQLRARYNTLLADYRRGKEFKRNGSYDKCSKEKKEIVDKKIEELFQEMLDILAALNERGLKAHDLEIENGFPVEITKPEYMTFGQYEAAAKVKVTIH